MRGTTTIHGFVACLVCLLVIAPRLAAALEIGPIEARSALYEPLDARIAIDGVRSGDLDGLEVVLGSPAQFDLAGVARLRHLALLKFTLVKQDDGGGYIRVWTDEPIIEPSLTFLVDVEWPRGRAVRGYKLHLSAAAGTAGASSSRRTAGQAEPEPVSGASAAPAAAPPVGSTYGPVRSSDTLWSIATRVRPDESISVQRMMLAILEANPQAFAFRNVNALNAGAILRIPTLDEIGSDDVNAAIAEVKSQHAAWKEYREEGRSAATPTTPDSTPVATGRIEVVSPETAPSAADIAEDPDVNALRERLALAMEEADTERRQANELKLRLVEAEDQIRKLGRLIDLQNEEVAALRAQLQAVAAATPAPSEMEPMPAPAPTEMEPTPAPMPTETEPAPTEMEPMPTPAPSETTPDPAEPETTPFGLGALPINPVFLVGGAGLLLILLGIVALLRRRRASSEEDDLAEPLGMAAADSASADDDGLLHELEAVAADLADDTDAPRRRGAQAALAVGSPDDADPDAGEGALLRLDPDSPADERTTEQWTEDMETERPLLGMVDKDDDADVGFDIDALTDDDFDSSRPADETSDEFNLDDPEELTAPVPDPDPDEDAGTSNREPESPFDETTDDGDTGALSLDDIGQDEMQTKLDLAQVYMEMGDTDSARGFLEAVLADGDTDQRDIARDMLSRLT